VRRPPWQYRRSHWRGQPQRFKFLWFAALFGGLLFFLLVGLGVALLVVLLAQRAGWQTTGGLLLALCAVPFVLLLLAGAFGGWGFRRFASPLAEIMTAADAIAAGDLSVRVRSRVPGAMGRLVSRFNHMASELERAEQQRRNLTADIAHELRNPLHIIQGNLEGMLDGVYSPDEAQLSATLEETRLLARLVNDLQMLSLAEAGQLPLHPAEIQVADLLADVRTSFASQAEARRVWLQVDLPADAAGLSLYADPQRLDQVLSNLVANALQHTLEGGTVTLSARRLPDSGVRLLVQDSGRGIPAEELPYIFDRFWRGDKARQRSGGSGLGLAIARQLVRAHGGEITADSQPGAGTTFTIDLLAEAAGVDQAGAN
jgi:two-component system OmpR family sensor kinase/two-component system sensor histidine kinase BaeS